MSRTRIPTALRRRILQQFHGRYANCHTSTAITGVRLVVDHVVPEVAGGRTEEANLCAACHSCNESKGHRTAVVDPDSGERVALFHRGHAVWRVHFRWTANGPTIVGTTATVRGTVWALNMNNPEVVEARGSSIAVGRHPPDEDL